MGSKSEDSGAEALVAQARTCFEAGADVVLVEGAELLRDGVPNEALVEGLRADLDTDRIIFELSGHWVPGTHHTDNYQLKVFLVRTFGPDVNLANVMPADVWETERPALRSERSGTDGAGVSGWPDTVDASKEPQ